MDDRKQPEDALTRADNLTSPITIDSSGAQHYLTILQGVITRMAANCTGCKNWCVTLVSAIVIVMVDKQHPEYLWIACLPLILFTGLDAYYLALERRYRNLYSDFVAKLHTGTARPHDVYNLQFDPEPGTPGAGTCQALKSTSIWPFYSLFAVILFMVWLLVLIVKSHG